LREVTGRKEDQLLKESRKEKASELEAWHQEKSQIREDRRRPLKLEEYPETILISCLFHLTKKVA